MDSFIVITLVKVVVVFATMMTTLLYLQWVERKVIAHIQVRPGVSRGPARSSSADRRCDQADHQRGPHPPYVNKPLYLAAPFIAMTMALLPISVIPFGPRIEVAGYWTWMQLTDLNIGVLFVLAVASMACTESRWPAGRRTTSTRCWRAAQLGADDQLRAAALAGHRRALLISNTLSLRELVERQAGGILEWNILHGPFPQILSFLIFLIAASRKPTACHSICRKPRTSWWPASTWSTAA